MTDEMTGALRWKAQGRWLVSSELFLDVIFTSRCNRSCAWCIARTRRLCAEDYGKWQTALARAFHHFAIDSVIILGGEATIDPLFWQKLALVEELARTHGVKRIILTTNGVKLTDEAFLTKLCASGIDSVNLSRMHDDQAVNDRIFGGPTPTAQDIRKIHKALTEQGKTLRLNVNIWRGNLDSISEMERFTDAFSGDCEAIKFSPLMDTAMFDTVPSVTVFTAEKAIPDDEIRILYDCFAERQTLIRRQTGVLGYVEYAEVMRGPQRILLKYAQVEDKYDRSRVIPTLKLYPNGCLSNEWRYDKDILTDPDT